MFFLLSTIFGFWLAGCIVCAIVQVAWWTLRFAFRLLGWLVLGGVILSLLAVPFFLSLAIVAALGAALVHQAA